MRMFADREIMRLALLSLFTARAEDVGGPCGDILDAATVAAAEAPAAMIPVEKSFAVRVGVGRLLNSLCGACRACPRGRGELTDEDLAAALTAPPPEQPAA